MSEQREHFLQFLEQMHPQDAERLNMEGIGNEVCRGIIFDGMVRPLKSSVPSLTTPSAGLSSTDLLLHDLDVMITPDEGTVATEHGFVFDASLDVSTLPHRNGEHGMDAALRELRGHDSSESADSQDDEAADDDEELQMLLCSDIVATTYRQDGFVCLDTVVPLEVCWVVPHSEWLILAHPGGTMHLTPSAPPQQQASLLQTWQDKLKAAITARLNSAAAATRRARCAIYLEDRSRIVIEEKVLPIAELVTDAPIEVIEEHLVQMKEQQQKPKRLSGKRQRKPFLSK